jgi:hypothetical protein
MHSSRTAAADLHWIPPRAGGHCVRFNGRVFEAIEAPRQHRPRRDLYHAALVIELEGDRYAIEVAPSPDADEAHRGVVATGAVGSRRVGWLRLFRYEVRRWRGGSIADLGAAVGGPHLLTSDPRVARRLLDAVNIVPTPVWGRDELETGEMWNSELRGRLADRHRKFVDRRPPAATARSRSRLARRPRGGAAQRGVIKERAGRAVWRASRARSTAAGVHVLFQWDFVWDFAALRWRVAATCEWAAPDRNCRCAGMSAMARPGLEPGTPRFSGSRYTGRVTRKGLQIAVRPRCAGPTVPVVPGASAPVWDFTRAVKSRWWRIVLSAGAQDDCGGLRQ